MNMDIIYTDEEDEDITSKYWGVIDPVDNSVDYDRLLSVVERSKEVWQLREENEKLTKTLDYYRTENESLRRANDTLFNTTFDSFVKLQKENEQLRIDYDTFASLANEVKRLREMWDELYNDWRKVWDILERKGIAKEMRQEFPNTFADTMESEEE